MQVSQNILYVKKYDIFRTLLFNVPKTINKELYIFEDITVFCEKKIIFFEESRDESVVTKGLTL